MFKDFDITKTKLIIWDLDDTFWDGTLTEGGVSFNNDNLRLIEELTTKGIMNSICSKNDFLSVKSEFVTQGYLKHWQLFLFPSINWEAKGQRVKSIIDAMQLREENVIVIDDNETNIKEIKYYCPNIMSAPQTQIPKIAKELYLVNDYDFEYTRLKQYKILEAKNKDKLLSKSSNEDFLRNSEIKDVLDVDTSNDASAAMVYFINCGNIRLMERCFEISRPLTDKQKPVVAQVIKKARNSDYQYMYVDIANKIGQIVKTFEYKFPSVSQVFSDINNYFKSIEI